MYFSRFNGLFELYFFLKPDLSSKTSKGRLGGEPLELGKPSEVLVNIYDVAFRLCFQGLTR